MKQGRSRAKKGQSKPRHRIRTTIDEKNRLDHLPLNRLTWPTVGIHDEPTRCYRINLEWTPIVTGMIGLLAETRMWKDVTTKDAFPIQQILELLEGEDCGMIDCNEVENCLETSPIADALTLVSYTILASNTEAHLDELALQYDGTAQSIGPAIPTAPANANSLHDNALCWALEQAVEFYAAGKSIGLSGEIGIARFFQDLVSAMRNVWRSFPKWLATVLGDELYGCVPDIPGALVVLADAESRYAVACCLREELRGVAMSEAAWNAALAACDAALVDLPGMFICMMANDSGQPTYLAFLEWYNEAILDQQEGNDFVCQCAPAGWFWVDLPWEWTTTLHGGEELSPLFTHTNPSNGELFAIQFRHRRIAGGNDKAFGGVHPSGEIDSVVAAATGNQASGLMLWEEPILGVWEARDAVGWPTAAARGANYDTAQRQANITWTIKFHDRVDLGHTRQSFFSNMRLLYKETV